MSPTNYLITSIKDFDSSLNLINSPKNPGYGLNKF